MLLDEGDNIGLKIDQVMRRVLNGGYERGGRTSRMMNGVPREYRTFAPVAIGAIGTLPLPLMARSIVINMQRSKRDDLKTKEQLNTPEETNRLEALRQLIVTWAQNTSVLSKAPKMPKILRLRAADNWRIFSQSPTVSGMLIGVRRRARLRPSLLPAITTKMRPSP